MSDLIEAITNLRDNTEARRQSALEHAADADTLHSYKEAPLWRERAAVWRLVVQALDDILIAADPRRTQRDCLDRSNVGCAEADDSWETIVGSDIPDDPEFPQAAEHRPGVGVMLDQWGHLLDPAEHYTVTAMDRIAGRVAPFAHVATVAMAYAVAGLLAQAKGDDLIEIWRSTHGEQHLVGRVTNS